MTKISFFQKRIPNYSRRTRITAAAILALALVILVAVVTANATPRSPEQIQIQGWVEKLQTDQLTTARQEAQHNLERAGEKAVPQLLVALRSNNATLRTNAADMLGYIASPQSTDALLNAMRSDPAPAVRRNAAYALGQIHSASAINELQKSAIADPSAMVRGAAADSLARIRTVLALNAKVNEQFIGTFAASSSQTDLVYVTTKRDLLTSRDGGNTWQTLSNALPSQVAALAVNPSNAQELYAGIESMGMFKSIDGGAHWNAINAGITLTPGARETISAIAIDPENTNTLYITRGVWLGTSTVEFHPIGLMASHDGGASWTSMSSGSSTNGEAIAKLAFRDAQLFGLAGDRVLTLVTPR